MKLIDLLVKELPRLGGWPDGVDTVRQNCKGQLFEINSDYYSGFKLEKCDDWITDVVTKQQYESALAASKAVVCHNGWIQWAGGECPVDSDAIVEVKCRWHNQRQYNNDRAGDFYWAHTGSNADIIAYRLQQPTKSEQVRADAWRSYAGITENDEEADLNECIGQNVAVEWDGEGLPPVGTICEAKIPRSITGWEWREVKVVESGIPGAEKEALVYDLETTFPSWADEFRPLRTEAEMAREKLAASLHIAAGASPIELNGIGHLYFKLADAIISGSVFGTTFKAGK